MDNYNKYKKYFPELSEETLNNMPEELLKELMETRQEEVVEENKESEATPSDNTVLEVIQKEEEPVVDNKPKEEKEPVIEEGIPKEFIKKQKAKKEAVMQDAFDSETGDIKINNTTPFSFVENTYNKFVEKNLMSTYHVILPISGYSTSLRGMTIAEQDFLKNSLESENVLLERLRKTIYNCMKETSVKMTYKEFLANTESTEISILMFGIMLKTFGKIKDYSFVCNKCGTKNIMDNFDIENFVTIKTELTKSIFRDIENPELAIAAFEGSKLKKYRKRVRLDNSKLVVELAFNNLLKDSKLERLFSAEEKKLSLYSVMTLLNAIYIPIFSKEDETVVESYAEVKAPKQMFNFLNKITKSDKDSIIDTVEEELSKFRITYETKRECSNIECRHEQVIEFNPIENFFKALLAD